MLLFKRMFLTKLMLVGVPSLSLATLDAVGRMKLSDPDVFRGGAGELATVTFEAVAFGRTGVLTDPDLARKVLDGVRTAPAGLKLRLDVARPPLPFPCDSDDTDDVECLRLLLLAPNVFRLDAESGVMRLAPVAELVVDRPPYGVVPLDDFFELALRPTPSIAPLLVKDWRLELGDDSESASKSARALTLSLSSRLLNLSLSSRLLRNGRVRLIKADV